MRPRFWARLTNGCWWHHGQSAWDKGQLRCTRCWLVIWSPSVVRKRA